MRVQHADSLCGCICSAEADCHGPGPVTRVARFHAAQIAPELVEGQQLLRSEAYGEGGM